jgi:hypothetical protein
MSGERKEYVMSECDLATVLEACRSRTYLVFGGHAPESPQQSANRAWVALGQRMGFDGTSVEPVMSKGARFFTAIPVEPETP